MNTTTDNRTAIVNITNSTCSVVHTGMCAFIRQQLEMFRGKVSVI